MVLTSDTISVSQLRKETISVMERASSAPIIFTVFSRSKPIAVLMSYATYQTFTAPSVSVQEWHDAFGFLTNPKKVKGVKRFNAAKEVRNLR